MNENVQALQPIDQRIFSYWQALYLSFFSKRLYLDVANRWKGFGMLYLLLVIALAATPFSIRVLYDFNQYFENQLLLPLKQLPPIYIQDGKASLDQPMPYFIKDKAGEVIALIDTEHSYQQLPNQYPKLNLLITKEKIFYRIPKPQLFLSVKEDTPSEQVSVHDIPKSDNEIFEVKKWLDSSGINRIKLLSAIIIYPIMLSFVYSMYLIFLLTFAFLGQVFSQVLFAVKLTYKESSRLLAVSATAQIFCFFILLCFNIKFPGLGFVFVGLIAAYYSYALIGIKWERRKLVIS